MMKIHPCVRKTEVFFYFVQKLKYLFWYLALWVDGVAHVIRVQVQVAISRSLSSGSLPKIKPPLPGVSHQHSAQNPQNCPLIFSPGLIFNLVWGQGRPVRTHEGWASERPAGGRRPEGGPTPDVRCRWTGGRAPRAAPPPTKVLSYLFFGPSCVFL